MKYTYSEKEIEEQIEEIRECTKPCEFIINEDGVLNEIKHLTYKNELIIPEGVVRIENRILNTSETANLYKIVFPSTLVDIGEENFVDLESPIEITINDNFIFENGCLYTKNYENLCLCLKNDVKGELFIKDGCETIYPFAFSGCRRLTKIVLPESIRKIGEWNFKNCDHVKEIVLPRQIDFIGECAFSGCCELEKIELPENLKKISFNMFYSCNLKELKIPNSIVEIEDKCIKSYNDFITCVDMFTKLILSKPNKAVTDYCNKYGIKYEFENSKEYTLEEAKDLCKNYYAKEFIKLFKEQYYAATRQKKYDINLKLQSIFNSVATMKIKGQSYIYDNQIRKWFLSNDEDIAFYGEDERLKRFYDKFCSFMLVYNSSLYVLNILYYSKLFN